MRLLALAFLLSACVLDEATPEDIAEVESEATVPAVVTTLTDDVFVTVSLPANSVRYFKLEVPAGFDKVSVYRNGYITTGPRFYMRRDQTPGPTNYDCTSNAMGCTVETPIAGTYYIAVYTGSQSYSSFSFAAGYHNDYAPISNNYSQTYYNQYGIDQLYKLAVPSNVSSLTFTYTLDPSDDGSIDLAVKRNAFANDMNYDCIKYVVGYNGYTQATCTFTNPVAGTYYVALLGHHAKVVGTFTARYRLAMVNAPIGSTTSTTN